MNSIINSYPSYSAVIFDLDGTLANTFPDLSASMNAMLEKCGYPRRSDSDLKKHINGGARDFVRYALPSEQWENEEELDRCLDIYSGIYDKNCCNKTVLYDGMLDVISKMKRKGIKIALNTNKTNVHAKMIIENLIPGIFDIVLGNGIFPSKPDPSGALWIASELGLDPSEIMFVGDSNVDMETATNAGMLAVGVKWGYREEAVLRASGAKHIVEEASELLDIALGRVKTAL